MGNKDKKKRRAKKRNFKGNQFAVFLNTTTAEGSSSATREEQPSLLTANPDDTPDAISQPPEPLSTTSDFEGTSASFKKLKLSIDEIERSGSKETKDFKRSNIYRSWGPN